MLVALKNGKSNLNFLSKKYACLSVKGTECVPVTIIVSKLYSNRLMLPVGALVSFFQQADVNLFFLKKDRINKRMKYFHFCSIILEQSVPSFL